MIAGMYGGDYDTITATWNLERDRLEAPPDHNGQRRHYVPCANNCCGRLTPAPWKKESFFCDNCIAAKKKALAEPEVKT